MARWKFTDAVMEVCNEEDDKLIATVRQIQAVQDLELHSSDGNVRCTIPAGTLGGWIEKEENLPQDSEAWVGENAIVYGDSVVKGSAMVGDNAVIDSSEVSGFARVYGNAFVQSCTIQGNAEVHGSACLYHCTVMDDAEVHFSAAIMNCGYEHGCEIIVSGHARIFDDACLVASTGSLFIRGSAWIHGNTYVESVKCNHCDSLTICGDASILDRASIVGSGFIGDQAYIGDNSDLSGNLAIGGETLVAIAKERDFNHAIAPYIPFDENRETGTAKTDEFLLMGPFRGEGENLFLTFTMDRGGDVHVYTRWHDQPIRFDISNARDFSSQLYDCGCFSGDFIPGIVLAYKYAEKQLWRRQKGAAHGDGSPTAAQESGHDNSLIPSISLGTDKRIRPRDEDYLETFLVIGPFRGTEQDMFLTFVVYHDGSMHMCFHQDFKPVCFDITDRSSFRKYLYECGYFAEDAVPDIFSAYKCARHYLLDWHLRKEAPFDKLVSDAAGLLVEHVYRKSESKPRNKTSESQQ